eukprot:TRINITY_DN8530_c0_g1_i2.p1 TRINITY_DN8530_c0_g1~~TRINITY_DN8530_c0_g1_i2.p1  ORF type:complete len:526 (-),score=199.82 TRINITY_DN8530_c0_g1_i2:93-1670(-)
MGLQNDASVALKSLLALHVVLFFAPPPPVVSGSAEQLQQMLARVQSVWANGGSSSLTAPFAAGPAVSGTAGGLLGQLCIVLCKKLSVMHRWPHAWRGNWAPIALPAPHLPPSSSISLEQLTALLELSGHVDLLCLPLLPLAAADAPSASGGVLAMLLLEAHSVFVALSHAVSRLAEHEPFAASSMQPYHAAVFQKLQLLYDAVSSRPAVHRLLPPLPPPPLLLRPGAVQPAAAFFGPPLLPQLAAAAHSHAAVTRDFELDTVGASLAASWPHGAAASAASMPQQQPDVTRATRVPRSVATTPPGDTRRLHVLDVASSAPSAGQRLMRTSPDLAALRLSGPRRPDPDAADADGAGEPLLPAADGTPSMSSSSSGVAAVRHRSSPSVARARGSHSMPDYGDQQPASQPTGHVSLGRSPSLDRQHISISSVDHAAASRLTSSSSSTSTSTSIASSTRFVPGHRRVQSAHVASHKQPQPLPQADSTVELLTTPHAVGLLSPPVAISSSRGHRRTPSQVGNPPPISLSFS